MLTAREKEESQRNYEETKRRFEEGHNKEKEIERIAYKFNRTRLLNKLCTIYIPTKPKDFWMNNPYSEETKKYNIKDADCFKHLPEYFLWLSKQMTSYKEKELKEENNTDSELYEQVTWSQVESTMKRKWAHYTVCERKELGIPETRRELCLYLDGVAEIYKDKFKTNEDLKK